ncbi:MAG: bifunctional hydroxymethylpyrimidine kinase/phosphomethylpyrimidine kinase [Akkermansia sp.]|nr:bifunctional hydroxymethylpyrimidine kinase/phosphomethylpyrimidine kinase [Akkermansia sp.]
MSATPVYITIAGSDCSAGAGLQADLKAGFALGCYPLTAVTCVVNEIPGCVEGIVPMEADFVAAQLRLCLSSFPVQAIKTGMLYSPDIVRAVVAELRGFSGAVVVDPVMIATAGEALILQEAIAVYEQELIPHTTLLTPNLDELARLCNCAPIHTFERMQQHACQLCEKYGCAILAKGGHLEGNVCIDLLVQPGGKLQSWSHPRTEGVSTHGTGCTLSSAITAWLAHGLPLDAAVEKGLAYVANAIATSHRLGDIDALNHHGE